MKGVQHKLAIIDDLKSPHHVRDFSVSDACFSMSETKHVSDRRIGHNAENQRHGEVSKYLWNDEIHQHDKIRISCNYLRSVVK